MLESILSDIRYSVRILVKHVRFSALVILILALGIGATTAIFSAVKSVILAPLPFEQSERMVRVLIRTESDGQIRTTGVSPTFFQGLRQRSRLIDHSAAQIYLNLSLNGERNADRVVGIGVSDQWAETLGIKPILGRTFSADEDAAGENSGVVLLSFGFWQKRFGGRADVLNETLTLNQRPYQVVGVMPASFRYPYLAELWTPMRFEPSPDEAGYLNVAARLKPGLSIEQVEAEVNRIGSEIAHESLGRTNMTLTARPFADEFRRDPNHSIAVLLFAVSFVLLLACVNVANLILVRSGARGRDFAIRSALGASRARQARQLLVESLLLAITGGAIGVGFAYLTAGWFSSLIPHRLGEVIQTVRLDPSSVIFAVVASATTAVLFGIMPALRLTEGQPIEAMKGGSRLGSVTGRSTMRWLVIAEVALAFVLMSGAGIVGQDFFRLSGADVGYDPANVITVGLGLPQPGYDDPAQRVLAVEQIVERVSSLPGVASSGVTTLHPIPRTTSNTGSRLIRRGDAVTGELPVLNMRNVTPSYLETLGLRALRGKIFATSASRGSTEVAVISQTAAERYWPGQDPVGQQVRFGSEDESNPVWTTIVGVVPDIAEPYDEIIGTIYRPYAQGTWSQPVGVWDTTAVTLLVRARGDAGSILSGVREAVGAVDKDISMFDIGNLSDVLAEPLQGSRFGATVFVGFAAFGLLLALLGTYGVIALSVNARIPEFGVRLALGIAPRGLLRLVMADGAKLVAAGLTVGFGSALILSRFIEPAVTQVSSRDPVTLLAVAGALALVGILASLVPAVRAMRIDPVQALRAE